MRYLRKEKDGTIYVYTKALSLKKGIVDFERPCEYVQHTTDGSILIWTPALHVRSDYVRYDGEVDDFTVQAHLSVKQRFEARIPLTPEQRSDYPEYAVKETIRDKEEAGKLADIGNQPVTPHIENEKILNANDLLKESGRITDKPFNAVDGLSSSAKVVADAVDADILKDITAEVSQEDMDSEEVDLDRLGEKELRELADEQGIVIHHRMKDMNKIRQTIAMALENV